jgi:glycosyltransferase involved in cell wall biosynthesis
MRVLLTTDYFLPEGLGGVERVVHEVGIRLAGMGHQVHVLTLTSSGSVTYPRTAVDGDGLIVHRLPAVDLMPILHFQARLPVGAIPRMASIVRSIRPDIINLHNILFFSSPVTALLRAVLAHGTPMVTTMHLGGMDDLKGAVGLGVRLWERTVARIPLGSSRRVICVSRAVARHAVQLGVSPDKLDVIPNGVDLSRFTPSPEDASDRTNHHFTIIFIGRMVFNKGPQYLVDAAPLVLAAIPNARFLMVGDGVERPRLERRVHQLGIDHAFRFTGGIHDVSPLLRASDVCVRPSLSEGMPLTVLEALASGIPVVATPVGGTPELVLEGATGVLTPVGDVKSLADAIIDLGRNSRKRRLMGEQGRELMEREYGWERVAAKTEQVYQKALDR